MKKNRTLLTIGLAFMTIALLGATLYISTLLSSSNSPTQIQKTKASAVTYTRKVDLFASSTTNDPTPTAGTSNATPPVSPTPSISATVAVSPTTTPTASPTTAKTVNPTLATTPSIAPTIPPTTAPTKTPTILAQSPTIAPTAVPTKVPTVAPTATTVPTIPPPSPTQSLLAYNSTTLSPTVVSATNKGGATEPTKAVSPSKSVSPTGVQQLPETGWIQTSSILFIVATSTILFSLLF